MRRGKEGGRENDPARMGGEREGRIMVSKRQRIEEGKALMMI